MPYSYARGKKPRTSARTEMDLANLLLDYCAAMSSRPSSSEEDKGEEQKKEEDKEEDKLSVESKRDLKVGRSI